MFDDLNKKVWITVKAFYEAGLQHLGKELYSVGPVTSPATLKNMMDRCQTIKTLLRLRAPSQATWNKFHPQLESLFEEIQTLTRAVKEMS